MSKEDHAQNMMSERISDRLNTRAHASGACKKKVMQYAHKVITAKRLHNLHIDIKLLDNNKFIYHC